ncbi:threonyl-tRNA synthetase [Ramicandelaber brevisporus]|nr:threonyl-tRNA synthetase [Ramicandelaber brevisporus]
MCPLEQAVQAIDLNGAAAAAAPPAVAPEAAAPAAAPAAGKKPAKAKKPAAAGNGLEANGHPLLVSPEPDYIKSRIDMFEQYEKEYNDWVAQQPREPIQITLPGGNVFEGKAWETTPMMVAKAQEDKAIAKNLVIAKVDGELYDVLRPLEKSCSLELLDFEHPEGKQVFWHSSAHVLGEACELHYGCHLCFGPPTESGFFYDMATDGRTVAQDDFPVIETLTKKIIKEKQPFKRLVLKKEQLLEMFKYNKYKVHFINDKVKDGESTTVYRCGPMIDLCVGPHITDTNRITAMMVTKNSASYFLGDANNDSLQRVYGISFPDKKQLEEYKKFLEEAAKRDHRRIGKDQELFFFNEVSPGSTFFMPHGTRILNSLTEFIRSEYRKRGYQEVVSPNMYHSKLWQQSGHWQHYAEDMFKLDVEKEQWALKPMNCPGHCIIFAHRDRSYRELPLRMAEFGVIHRNEASGALSGLTRVRRFVQDDSHIFCTQDQIEVEIDGVFDFMKKVYGTLGLSFNSELSTRPDEYLGELAVWDEAERMLTSALNKSGNEWKINPGDGAFYGPKIDIFVTDALGRRFQCATIQLDYNLPQRFNLEYRTSEVADGTEASQSMKRPVMIHRAILGSLERMTGILTEHFAGKWPFWLSPRQVVVIPIDPAFNDYVKEVTDLLTDHGMFADADVSGKTLKNKIRSAELEQYNFIIIVGEEEKKTRSVNIRVRDDPATKNKGATIPLDEAINKLNSLKATRGLKNQL